MDGWRLHTIARPGGAADELPHNIVWRLGERIGTILLQERSPDVAKSGFGRGGGWKRIGAQVVGRLR